MRPGSAACRAAGRAAASARAPASSPGPRGGGGSPRRWLSAQFLELGPVGGELLPLLVDHVRGRLRYEALVGELALPPLYLGPELHPPLLDARRHGRGIDPLGLQQLDSGDARDRRAAILRELDPGKPRDQLVRSR